MSEMMQHLSPGYQDSVLELIYDPKFVESRIKEFVSSGDYDNEKEARDYYMDYVSGSGAWVVEEELSTSLYNSWSKAIKYYCKVYNEYNDNDQVDVSVVNKLAKADQSSILKIKSTVSSPQSLLKKLNA